MNPPGHFEHGWREVRWLAAHTAQTGGVSFLHRAAGSPNFWHFAHCELGDAGTKVVILHVLLRVFPMWRGRLGR